MRKILFICTAFILFLSVPVTFAADVDTLTGMTFAKLAMGGILYDNWLAQTRVKIKKNHPSYPPVGKQKGETTWRCKECHGWDYKGSSGAYSEGSHYTGIRGIRAFANQAPRIIMDILNDKNHLLGEFLDKKAMESLALFVAYGQVDMDLYVDRKTRKSIGDPANGGRIYLSTCIKCHGVEGKDINFKISSAFPFFQNQLNVKDDSKPEYIGTAASRNPWETLHKIRWGHPRSQMISLLFLDLKEQLDVLSFCQTLPTE
jgi:thiosulfate dehydrogenase